MLTKEVCRDEIARQSNEVAAGQSVINCKGLDASLSKNSPYYSRSSDYFKRCYSDSSLLKSHGFDHWPDVDELTIYLFRLEEKIDLLAQILGYQLERDVRGRLHAYQYQGGDLV